MKPTWWQLYGIGVLLVALIGVIEAVPSAGALRTTLEASQPDSSRLGAAPMNPMLTCFALAFPYLVAIGRVVLALGARDAVGGFDEPPRGSLVPDPRVVHVGQSANQQGAPAPTSLTPQRTSGATLGP